MTSTRRPIISPANESGQTLTEYSLLVAVIAVGVAVTLPAVASTVEGMLSAAAAALGS
jgi:Flp pilus assembly pilin Flp